MTQAELAAISGVDQGNISAIENRRRMPSAGTLHRLLFACGYELAAVAGSQVLPLPPPDDPDLVLDDDRRDDVAGSAALPMATRVRMMTAVLDASEAILRSR